MKKFNDNRRSTYHGKKLAVEIFGASHAEEIGVVVDGFIKGETYDESALQEFLNRRRAVNTAYSTKRFEPDIPVILSGAKDGVLSGEKFLAVVKNTNVKSTDYDNVLKIPRPSHADFVGYEKYGDGFDYRGGGKFSGRLTVATCIAGGICKQLLAKRGVKINAFITQIGSVKGKTFSLNDEISVKDESFSLLDESVKADMMTEIENASKIGDSVGGKIQCVVTGVPVGTGEFMFDSVESVISQLAFSVPAVKGIEFGLGFDYCSAFGSKVNDEFYYENGVVKTFTNNNGGINGGIANGMPIDFSVAIKPTPSISIKQKSVNLDTKENVELIIKGRHDACIVPRAVVVIEAITAIAIYDLLNK